MNDHLALPPLPVRSYDVADYVPWTDLVRRPAEFSMAAYGIPGPQGSKRHVGKGVMVESSKKVKPWRAAVAAAAVEEVEKRPEFEVLDGPLVADMIFTMPKGVSIPKWKQWPSTTPDLSKLVRSTEDALKGVVWKDDARVIAYRRLEKVYLGADRFHIGDTLRAPGVLLRVWKVPAEHEQRHRDLVKKQRTRS